LSIHIKSKGETMKYRLAGIFLFVSMCTSFLFADPNGAVLYRNGKRLGYHKVSSTAEHHYFGYLEGPAWENKYCAFRYYIDKDDRNVIDIIGKYKEEAILQHFSDTAVDEHNSWPWGTDILKVNSAVGLGAFRLYNNNAWINPQIPETIDSLVVTIRDSSVQTPSLQIGYYGWNIGGGNKIDALLTLSTTLNERVTHCEITIKGNYSGKVVVGMVNHRDNTSNPNRSSIKLIQDTDPPLLATLGRQGGLQEGFADTLLLAAFTDKSFFDSFVNDGTTNYGMVLKPDSEKKVTWSIAYSWAREANPLFRNSNWKEQLRVSTGIHSVIDDHISLYPHTASASKSRVTADFFTLTGRAIGIGSYSTDHSSQGIVIMRKAGITGADMRNVLNVK
jgi:hypothetical protein